MRIILLAFLYLPCLAADRILNVLSSLDALIDARIEERIDAYLEGETVCLIEEVLGSEH